MSILVLETDRLILKPLNHEDIEVYERLFAEYEVIRYLSTNVPWPYPKGECENYLTTRIFPNQGIDQWMWGIFVKDPQKKRSDALIGAIHLWRKGIPENRGFWLTKTEWGKGYMTEACEAVNRFAFEQLAFEELIFSNAVGNAGSRRVKEKTGCEFIGREPCEFVDPALNERELWKLSRSSWLIWVKRIQ